MLKQPKRNAAKKYYKIFSHVYEHILGGLFSTYPPFFKIFSWMYVYYITGVCFYLPLLTTKIIPSHLSREGRPGGHDRGEVIH